MAGAEYKSFRVSLKDSDDPGHIVAQFAVFNEVDSDGDVTLPGAFGNQDVVVSAWGHASWMGGSDNLPVGKGSISEKGNKAIFEGDLFLETTSGKDHYEVLKQTQGQQEWSYGFQVQEASFGDHNGQEVRFLKKLKVPEVSPVLKGAGSDTRTLAVKGSRKLADQGEELLAELGDYSNRLKSLATLRADEGRPLSVVNLRTLGSVRTELQVIEEELAGLLMEDGKSAQPPNGMADEALLLYLSQQHRMNVGGIYA